MTEMQGVNKPILFYAGKLLSKAKEILAVNHSVKYNTTTKKYQRIMYQISKSVSSKILDILCDR